MPLPTCASADDQDRRPQIVVVLGVGRSRIPRHTLTSIAIRLPRKTADRQGQPKPPAADQLRDKIKLLRATRSTPGDRLGPRYPGGPFALWFASSLTSSNLLWLSCRQNGRGRSGSAELAELVTHHFLVDRYRHMLLAVVDAEHQTDELRQDGRARLQILITS